MEGAVMASVDVATQVEAPAPARVQSVPITDLYAQYLALKPEIDAAIAGVIAKSAYIRGPYVDAFEADFAAATGAEHCVSCANGTDALYITMRALGLKPGDEVITSAHSWIATAETITQAGGKVVFCDTDRDTFTIDTTRLAGLITPRTVGIIPVHLYGQAADMDAVLALAKRHGLWVIEDAAQAHLATYKGRTVGTFGAAATFSFYPSKNLGALGDAGAIVTNDAALARRMAMFARHGGLNKHDHEIEGINSRLDGLQAAVLSVKLARLPAWTKIRQGIASAYDRELATRVDIATPAVAADREHVYHLYVIKHDQRDALADHLKARGVQTGINYPVALPFLRAYAHLGHRPEDFPNAFHNQSRILSLPMFPEMSDAQRAHVVDAIGDFRARRLKSPRG
jgi:dTDP-4-amino-4,6-dideoxygalactose transaminase